MRVLIVEDSEKIRSLLQSGLTSHGMAVDVARDGEEGLAFVDRYPYDVVVLDLMMPRLHGLEVLKRIRAAQLPVRVLVLSALDEVGDRVKALDLGADDYLVKPYSFAEICARIRALARRDAERPAPDLVAGGVRLDTIAKLVIVGEKRLSLPPKEYALLELLMRRRGQVMSRAEIFEHLYASDSDASDRVIEVLMSMLRTKLAKAGAEGLIETRRGFGYVLA